MAFYFWRGVLIVTVVLGLTLSVVIALPASTATKFYPLPVFVDKEDVPVSIYVELEVDEKSMGPFDLAQPPDNGAAAVPMRILQAFQSEKPDALLALTSIGSLSGDKDPRPRLDDKGMEFLRKGYNPVIEKGKVISPFRICLGSLSEWAIQSADSTSETPVLRALPVRKGHDGTESWPMDQESYQNPLVNLVEWLIPLAARDKTRFSPTSLPEGYQRVPVVVDLGDGTSQPHAWLHLRVVKPTGDPLVYSGGSYHEGVTTADDPVVSKVLEFYRDTLRIVSTIPDTENYLDSPEMASFLSKMTPESAAWTKKNIANKELFHLYKSMNLMQWNEICFVIAGDPLYLVYYKGRKNAPPSEYEYKSVLRNQDGTMRFVNEYRQTPLKPLLSVESVKAAMADAVK